jgi:hypothetical protein
LEVRDEQRPQSFEVARAAMHLASTLSREEERMVKSEYAKLGILGCAVDFGGDFNTGISRVIERAVVAAKRESIIADKHSEVGCVAGAAHEALQQIAPRAMGLSVGGKIGIARQDEHLTVCVFFGVGLLHLNEVTVGLAHRVL